MNTSSFESIKEFVVSKLQNGLSGKLQYHSLSHTLDVLKQALIIAELENVKNPDDLFLLQIGALYHDTGFLDTYSGHEERSCKLAQVELPQFNLAPAQIELICGLIRATQVPQKPQNLLEQIICDADLDYLGRDDFYTIGAGLYQEFIWQGVVTNEWEWNQIQIKFLEKHQYFTASSQARRKTKKQEHLTNLKANVAQQL